GAVGGAAERPREAAVVRVHAYNTLGVALARTGRLGEAVEQIERSIALAEARDLLQAASRGYTNLGVLHSSIAPPPRRPAAATPLAACPTAPSIPRAASNPAGAASTPPRKWAIWAFSRGCTPISRWPTARSPTAARRKASRPRRPPSTSTGGSACWTISQCR